VDGIGQSVDDLRRRVVRTVVHHHQVVGLPGLIGDNGQRLGQQIPAVPGDDDGDHAAVRERAPRRVPDHDASPMLEH